MVSNTILCPFESRWTPGTSRSMSLKRDIDGSGIYEYQLAEPMFSELGSVWDGKSLFLTEEFRGDILRELSDREKSAMLYMLLHSTTKTVFTQSDTKDEIRFIEAEYYHFVSRDSLNLIYPVKLSDRINMVLRNLLAIYPNFGESFFLGRNEDEFNQGVDAYIFMPDKVDRCSSWTMLKSLIEFGYMGVYKGSSSADGSQYYLTVKTWEYLERMDSENTSNKIFVAMSFAENEKQTFFREQVKYAISDCGYEPIIIDEYEHENYIPPEIEYQIKQSAGVIADLTGNNRGVYFESGCARGMKKPVIFTCNKEEDKSDIHFDVKQINTIFWDIGKKDELIERLTRRIRAVIGERKTKKFIHLP